MSIDRVKQLLTAADQKPNNIFSGWTKLQTIVGKAQTHDGILWAFCGLNDMWQMGKLPDGLSLRALQGKDAASGNKGPVDLLNFKNQVRVHLLGPVLDELPLKPDVKSKMRDVFQSHDKVRNMVSGLPGGDVDTTWRGGWPKPAEDFLHFVDSMIFDEAFDSDLKHALKTRRSPADAVENCAAISEELRDIKEAFENLPRTARVIVV